MIVILVFLATIVSHLQAQIIFNSLDSTIHLAGSSQFNGLGAPLEGGTLQFDFGAELATSIGCQGMRIIDGDSEFILSGDLSEDMMTTNTHLMLAFGGNIDISTPQPIYTKIQIIGTDNSIYGYPIFINPYPLDMDADSNVVLGLSSPLNQTIELGDNSQIILEVYDLRLSSGVTLEGEGSVSFNNGADFIIGAQETVWTSTIRWINAQRLVLTGNVRLFGTWIFEGDCSIVGNNNTIDISQGGQIEVLADGVLELNNTIINGLGTGDIVLEDEYGSGELILKQSTIIMNDTYEYSVGTWVAHDNVKIITGEHTLTFADDAVCVVTGGTLFYDPLGTPDINNIRFQDTEVNRVYDAGGSIKKVRSVQLGDYRPSGTIILDDEIIISPLRRLIIEDDVTINGSGFYYEFARNTASDIVQLEDGASVVFTDIFLKDFPLDAAAYGAASRITFADATQVALGTDGTLTTTWYIDGVVVIDGSNRKMTFGTDGNIVLRPGSSLLLDNITLDEVHGYKIRCMDNTATVSLGSVVWQQDDSFSFTNGRLVFLDRCDLKGSSTFYYSTSQSSTISNFATLAINPDATFMYAPPSANRTLIWMAGDDAVLELNGGTLASTTTGLVLTRGTLDVRASSIIRNVAGVAESQAISVGDGIAAHDITMDLAAGVEFDIRDGLFLIATAV